MPTDASALTGVSHLVDLLRYRATHDGRERGYTYVVDGETARRHLTYEQLDQRARAIAARLQSLNLAGERALLLYPTGLDFIAAFFGCLYAGVIAVPAYPPRRNRNLKRIQAIAADATPRIALTVQEVLDRVELMAGDTPTLEGMRWWATDSCEVDSAEAWTPPQIDPQTLAFLQYTSGSTGAPKGVMLSHANLMHNASIISRAFQPRAAAGSLFWLPLYHDMGLIGGVLQPLYLGNPNTLFSATHFLQKPVRWMRLLSDLGAGISGGPNFAYDLCVERVSEEEKDDLDLSQWSLAFNGAEPVRAETMDRFTAAFSRCGFRREAFYPCYGLAEATLLVTGGERDEPPVVRSYEVEALQAGRAERVKMPGGDSSARRLVSSGRSLANQRVEIVDSETGDRMPEGRVGEIWVAGPSVARGYWQRPDLSIETFGAGFSDKREPFLRTGDLGFFDDGELFIAGRVKDLIIIRGVNHYPQDIELTVQQAHDDLRITPGAAFSIGGEGAERLVVVQETTRRRHLAVEEICAAIRRSIAAEHDISVAAIVLLKPHSIPRTSSGKIQRTACRDAYLAGTLSSAATWSADQGLRRGRNRVDDSAGNGIAPCAPAKLNTHGRREPISPAMPSGLGLRQSAANSVGIEARRDSAVVVLDLVRGVARDRAGDLNLDTNLMELSLDSLERMEIVAAVEDHFGGRFPEEAILEMHSCRDIVTAVEKHLQVETVQPTERHLVQPEDYDFAQFPEYRKLRESFQVLDRAGFANPYFTCHEGITTDRTVIAGREYVNYCSYNYLGMSGDPHVVLAAQQAIECYGTSVSASRLVSGEKPIHGLLERALADFIGAEEAVVFVGGHATNETTIGHLMGPGDLILHDALAHNSIIQGCRMSGARRRAFPHNDWEACGQLLQRYRSEHRRVLIVVEGVYSMDGDWADLYRFAELKRRHRCNLMVDEAHSLGTMGRSGRGMSEFCDLHPRDVDLWMGTLSKSLGSCGGYIAGTKELVEYLKYTAPGFVYSVGLSPANAAAAAKSLELLEAEPERVERLRHNAALFLRLARQAELNTGLSHNTPIVPVITGNSLLALELSQGLFGRGINVQPIMHPAVEESAARLRFFLTSTHTEEQIRDTVEVLADEWRRLMPSSHVPRPHLHTAPRSTSSEPILPAAP